MSTPQEAPSKPQQRSAVRVMVALLWALLGVRKNAEYQRDLERINPVHVIVAGLVVLIVFVFLLMILVRWMVTIA